MPNAIILLNPGGESGKELEKLIPFIKEMKPLDRKATVYVCENYSCQAPTTDLDNLEKILDRSLSK
jgi:uncharacterized protein YyaL (SSP411 family)